MKKSKTNRRSNHPFLGGLCLGASLLLAVGFYSAPNTKSANIAPSTQDSSQPTSVASVSTPLPPRPASQSHSPQTAGSRQFAGALPGHSPTLPASIPQQTAPGQSVQSPVSTPPGVIPPPSQFIAPGLSAGGAAAPEAANRPEVQPNLTDPTGLPSQGAETPPALAGPPIGASPAPGPNFSPSAPSDLAWRLLAQLAVHDTNVTTVLVENARQSTFPGEAWPAIATTLVSESLENGVLVKMDPSALAGPAVQEGHQRLDLIESLLAVAPESAGQTLRDKVAWLSQQLSK